MHGFTKQSVYSASGNTSNATAGASSTARNQLHAVTLATAPGVGRRLRLIASGVYTLAAGEVTVEIAFAAAPTTIIRGQTTTLGTNIPYLLEAVVLVTTAGAAGVLASGSSARLGSSDPFEVEEVRSQIDSAVDLTGQPVIEVAQSFDTSDAGNSVTSRVFIVEVLN